MGNIKQLFILMVFVLFVAACSGNSGQDAVVSEEDGEQEKVIRLSAPGEIPGLSPTLADNDFSFDVINQVFEGLYRLDKDGEPQLAIAAEEPEVSEDKQVYTFQIRKDATWSDGSAVTAHDFEYAWKKAVDPETGAAYGPQMEEIIANASEILKGEKPADTLGIEALDNHTLKITLDNPVPFFKELLTTAIFFPQKEEFVEAQGDKYATASEHTLFNGPFVLANWKGSGSAWTYKKNEQYWDKEAVKVDRIEMNVVKDTETAVNLYERGQLDKVDLTGDYVDAYQSHDEYHTELTGSTSYLKMNQGKDGEQTDLANLHIRKALNMALDKEQMVDTILNNGSIVAQGNVPKGLAENPETGEDFRAENGDLTHEDPEAARDHWEKGLAELGKDALTFAVTTTDSDSSKRFAENFKHQLEEKLPGLTLDIKVVTPKASVAANVGQDYELIFTGWNGDYQDPLTYLNLFITDSPGNHTGYTDPAYDKLVLGAKSDLADKPEERWEALLKAEKMLIEDSAVLIPLYQKGTAYMQKANVKNLTTYQVSADNYKWAEIE